MSVSVSGPHPDSCTWSTITGLSWSDTGPEAALLQFCRGQYNEGGSCWEQARSVGSSSLFAFYVFSNPVGKDSNNPSNLEYAKKFADYLEDHNLGHILRSPVAENIAFHGGRKVQIFIWTPDQKAMKAWYAAHKPAAAKVTPAKSK